MSDTVDSTRRRASMKRQESTIVPPDEEKPQVTTHIHTKDFRSMTDRAVTENPDTGEPIIYPEAKRMLIDELFNKDGKINHKDKPWEKLRDHFLKEGRLHVDTALKIVKDAHVILQAEPTLIELGDHLDINVVGDIHGQYYDLMTVFRKGGPVEGTEPDNPTRYLFLGDYVDRGNFSIEVLLYLYFLKICFPTTITLLRGNHENKHICETFTFEVELDAKYNATLYDACIDSFDILPLAATVNRYLCVHGGISPDLQTLEDIKNLDRFKEVPVDGPMNDLVWADPWKNFDTDLKLEHYLVNVARGCSYYFSFPIVRTFLKNNNLVGILRAHELQKEGYKEYFCMDDLPEEQLGTPSVTTVFSAPDYCGRGNTGAFLQLNTKEEDGQKFIHRTIIQYYAVDSPYWLPDFCDVITWSLPFAAEKITNILVAISSNFGDDDDEPLSPEQEEIYKKLQQEHSIAHAEATQQQKPPPPYEPKETEKKEEPKDKKKSIFSWSKGSKKPEKTSSSDLDKDTDSGITGSEEPTVTPVLMRTESDKSSNTSQTLKEDKALSKNKEKRYSIPNVFRSVSGSFRAFKNTKALKDQEKNFRKVREEHEQRLQNDPDDNEKIEDPEKLIPETEVSKVVAQMPPDADAISLASTTYAKEEDRHKDFDETSDAESGSEGSSTQHPSIGRKRSLTRKRNYQENITSMFNSDDGSGNTSPNLSSDGLDAIAEDP